MILMIYNIMKPEIICLCLEAEEGEDYLDQGFFPPNRLTVFYVYKHQFISIIRFVI